MGRGDETGPGGGSTKREPSQLKNTVLPRCLLVGAILRFCANQIPA